MRAHARDIDRPDARLAHIREFYRLMDALAEVNRGPHLLEHCHGRMNWPTRGVYFFFESDEKRIHSGDGLRIVRIGTHALKIKSRTSLWNRLSQHRGNAADGGGNHRGSIFRLLVGGAILARSGQTHETWGVGSSAPRDIRYVERAFEREVSVVIGAMPFLWLEIDDEASPESDRGLIERNAIALLSNLGKPAIDPPSADWLGLFSDRERVRASGLWNQNHVDETYDPAFLERLEDLIEKMRERT